MSIGSYEIVFSWPPTFGGSSLAFLYISLAAIIGIGFSLFIYIISYLARRHLANHFDIPNRSYWMNQTRISLFNHRRFLLASLRYWFTVRRSYERNQ